MVRDRNRLFSKCHQYLFLFNCYCLYMCNETHISDIWIWDLYNNPCQYSEVIVGFQANIYFFRLLLFAEVSDVSMCHFTTENVNLVEKTWLYGVFHPFKFIYIYVLKTSISIRTSTYAHRLSKQTENGTISNKGYE